MGIWVIQAGRAMSTMRYTTHNKNQHKHSNLKIADTSAGRRAEEMRRDSSCSARNLQHLDTISTRASRRATSSQLQELSQLNKYSPTRSSCLPPASRIAKSEHRNNHCQPSTTNMAYRGTDLTLSHVPKGSSIVTAVIHFSEPKSSLNALAPARELLGGMHRCS